MMLGFLIMIGLDQAAAFNNPPARCEGFGDLQSISLTDWEAGSLGSWTAGTHGIADPDFFDTPDWAVVGSLPDGRTGKAAFVADQENGNCLDDDKSGALTLDSPPIVIPAGTKVPRISIDHWFATDKRWDGGNFKISINGGDFNLIPGFVIEEGAYNSTLFTIADNKNLNPLAGQDAFTTDDNQPSGSWGQSHINLLGIAEVGDTIILRLDFGIDECDGWIGWYVDEVEFYSCSTEFPPSDTSLTLVKQVINDNGGGAAASAWTLSATGPTPFSGSGPNVSSGDGFAPGSYDLSETGPTGYKASLWACVGGTQIDGNTVSIAQDEIATCTITNNDIAPTLKVFKTIVNSDGGTVTDPNAFGLRVDGNPVLHNVSNTFNSGDYLVSEVGLPGYQPGSWGGDCTSNGSINLTPGQNATCRITNDDIAPTLKVVKTVTNDNGGMVTNPNDFGLKVDGGNVLHNVRNVVDVGSHTVSEDGLAGYQAGDWGGDCNPDGTIALVLGQIATCNITNNDISPTLKVVKTITNDNGGTVNDPDAFGLRVDGDAVLHNVINSFDAGNHTVSEDGLDDYTAGSWGGDCNPDGTITLVLDQDAICTITNDDINPFETIFRDGFE